MRIWKGGRILPVAVLTCLVILSDGPAQGQPLPNPRDRLTIALPDTTWAVEIRTPGFTIQKDEVSSDGTGRYVYAVRRDPDVALSVRLERATGHRTPTECRRFAWDRLQARSPFRMNEVVLSETKELALLEYRVKEFADLPVEQQHIHGYVAKDNVCAEIHVSKVRATAADRQALVEIVESARVRVRAPGGRVF